jgi:hypothetical protein
MEYDKTTPSHRDVAAFNQRAIRYEEGWLGRLHHQIADRTQRLPSRSGCRRRRRAVPRPRGTRVTPALIQEACSAGSTSNTGCSGAMARIWSSLESGPMPSKKIPTSAFHLLR